VLRLGTNPRVKDTDGDGLSDGAEVANGTDPKVAEAPAVDPLVPFAGMVQTLRSAGLDADQEQTLVDQIVLALDGGQLSPEGLAALLAPVAEALADAGLPAEQVSSAMLQEVAALSGVLPSDPSGLLDLVIDTLQEALVGTPLADLNPILQQVQSALADVVGSIVVAPPTP
jgi:hypothetical protein